MKLDRNWGTRAPGIRRPLPSVETLPFHFTPPASIGQPRRQTKTSVSRIVVDSVPRVSQLDLQENDRWPCARDVDPYHLKDKAGGTTASLIIDTEACRYRQLIASRREDPLIVRYY